MALDSEIEQVRKDTERWRSLVDQLLRREDELAPRHLVLLDSLSAKQRWLEQLSFLQAEWLLDIRDDMQTVTEHRGCSVQYLLERCYESRLSLDEDDEAWVIDLHDSGRTAIRRYEARRLLRLAVKVGDIDD